MNLDNIIKVLLMAAAPIGELRLALPVAMHTYNYSWQAAFLVSVIGNLLPIPFVLLLLDPVARIASKVKLLDRLIQWVFSYTGRRSDEVKKYEGVGLMLFVAIPLPGTGAWTGAIVAYLLKLNFWYAFVSIALGVVIAGVIVTVLSILGWVGALIAGLALAALAVSSLLKMGKKSEKGKISRS